VGCTWHSERDKQVKKLYAGPWVGEFGWELCSWNPSIRHIAKDYDHVTVEVQPGMEYLYEFADEILINPRLPNFDVYSGIPSKPRFRPPADVKSIAPDWFWKHYASIEFNTLRGKNKNHPLHPKEWRKYGVAQTKKVADIMCAFRGPKIYRKSDCPEARLFPEKQYPDVRCTALAESFLKDGYSVACYGGEDNFYVEGTIDFRGVPLSELCNALSQAELAIGPSSGTLHLASLCGTPHVTWFGKRPPDVGTRYLSYWNPFSTPVTFIDVPCPEHGLTFKVGIERMDKETPNLHRN